MRTTTIIHAVFCELFFFSYNGYSNDFYFLSHNYYGPVKENVVRIHLSVKKNRTTNTFYGITDTLRTDSKEYL